jgi:hypothetical protein
MARARSIASWLVAAAICAGAVGCIPAQEAMKSPDEYRITGFQWTTPSLVLGNKKILIGDFADDEDRIADLLEAELVRNDVIYWPTDSSRVIVNEEAGRGIVQDQWLRENPPVQVLPRAKLKSHLYDMELPLLDLADRSKASQVGKRLEADYVMLGLVRAAIDQEDAKNRPAGKWHLSIETRIIDVAGDRIVWTGNSSDVGPTRAAAARNAVVWLARSFRALPKPILKDAED